MIKYLDTEIHINNDVTGDKPIKITISDYVTKLDEVKSISLDSCKTNNKLLNMVKDTVTVFTEMGLSNGKNEDIDYDELMDNFGILNCILNDVMLFLHTGKNNLGDLLCKYKKDGKKLFTDCDAFNLNGSDSKTYDNVREFFNGILDVHNKVNKQVQRVRNEEKSIMTGGIVLNHKSHQFIIDYSSLTGGEEKCCKCPPPMPDVRLPTTGPSTDEVEVNSIKSIIGFVPDKKQTAGAIKDEAKDTDDANKDDVKNVGSIDDWIKKGNDGMKDLVYAERNLSDNDKSQFDWIYWKFYRLWTMEKLHPVLTLPLDMVDPILQTTGTMVKRIVSPIIGKTIPPLLNTVWQALGVALSASAMVPFVGVVTGALSAAHSAATVPVSFLIREAANTVQFLIDGTMEFMSMIFNLQRKNWGLVVDAFLRAFQLNGLYATFLGHLRTLTKILKRINNILDELKQYPDFADQVLKKMDEYPEILEWIKKIDVEKLEKDMVRLLKIGTGLSKRFGELTNGLAFATGLPDTLIDDDDDEQIGGADREKLVKQYLKVAFTPINTKNEELIREKIRLLYELDDTLH